MEKYFTIIQKGQDAICEDLHFCCDSENEDDVFGVACDEAGNIDMEADDYLAVSGSEDSIFEILDGDSGLEFTYQNT